jgi:hypothetical protein
MAFFSRTSVLRLQDRFGKKEWLAVVEIIDYVRASVANFEDALARRARCHFSCNFALQNHFSHESIIFRDVCAF